MRAHRCINHEGKAEQMQVLQTWTDAVLDVLLINKIRIRGICARSNIGGYSTSSCMGHEAYILGLFAIGDFTISRASCWQAIDMLAML